jgi:hypothetical protein
MEIDINDIDFVSLRSDLIDYFGSASPIMPFAMSDVVNVENASDMELLNIINQTSLNLLDYVTGESLKKVRHYE